MNANHLKLTVLLTALTVLFVMIGQAIGGSGGMVIAIVMAVVMNGAAYWFSDRMVLAMSGARELQEGEHPWLRDMVTRLAANANLPMPKLYIMETDVPNAFATGRDPKNGVVAVTTGIMRLLDRDELAGVVAHELAHIKHRDTLLSAIVATIAGAITMIANMGQWALMFGGLGGSDDEEGQGNFAGGLLMLFIAPIAAILIQMGISRAREFHADEGGANILGDPRPLASALEKIERYAQGAHEPLTTNPATTSLYIINPLSGASMLRWFSTHPPTEQRVARLLALAETRPNRHVVVI